MQANSTKFPSGIASLAAKLHAKRLKLGLCKQTALWCAKGSADSLTSEVLAGRH